MNYLAGVATHSSIVGVVDTGLAKCRMSVNGFNVKQGEQLRNSSFQTKSCSPGFNIYKHYKFVQYRLRLRKCLTSKQIGHAAILLFGPH